MVYAILGWFMLSYCAFALVLVVCAWLGWPISLPYCVLKCIAGCFPHYLSGGDCIHLASIFSLCPPFFDDIKRGKMGMTLFGVVCLVLSWLLKFFLMGMTLFGVVCLVLSWLLKFFFYSCVAWMFDTNIFLPFMVNMVIWFVVMQKGEVINPSFVRFWW